MNKSIFGDENEEYLRSLIEADEALESNPEVALEKVLQKQTRDIRETPGNKSVSSSMLPSKGIFYPDDLVITISPLKVKHIRHFSTIDETDEIDISSKLNFIINSSIQVQSFTPGFSPLSLLEIDRLYLLFLVRNITFIEFPSIIKLESTCKECSHVDMVDVRAERLGAMKEGSLDQYLSGYSKDSRSIQFLMSGEDINMYLPSMENLETSRRIILENNLELDQQDRFMLCFLVPPHVKLSKSDFDRFESELEEWTPDKYSLVRSFVNTVNSSYSIDVYYKCSECGAGVTAPLRFHRGIKELFVPELSDRSK